MLRQGLVIARWINKFDPDKIIYNNELNDSVDDFPRDLNQFEKFVNISLKEIDEYLFSKTRSIFDKRKITKVAPNSDLLLLK